MKISFFLVIALSFSGLPLKGKESAPVIETSKWFDLQGQAAALLDEGKVAEAEDLLQQALEAAGTSKEARAVIRFHLGVCRLLQNKPESDLMKTYASSDSASPDVMMLYARSLMQEERMDEARSVLWNIWKNGDAVLKMSARQFLLSFPALTRSEKKRLTRPSPGEADGVNNDHLLHSRRVVDGRLVP